MTEESSVRPSLHGMVTDDVTNLRQELAELRKAQHDQDNRLTAIESSWPEVLKGIDYKLGQLLEGRSPFCTAQDGRIQNLEAKAEKYDQFCSDHADTVKQIAVLWKVLRWQWAPMLFILVALGSFLIGHILREPSKIPSSTRRDAGINAEAPMKLPAPPPPR